MARRRGKIKFGNILLLLALIGVGYYFFNRKKVDDKLRDLGLEVPGSPSQVPDDAKPYESDSLSHTLDGGNETETDENIVKSDTTTQNQNANDGSNANPSGSADAEARYIITENEGNVLIADEQNPVTLKVKGLKGWDLSLLSENPKQTELSTRNRANGEYLVYVKQPGEVGFSIMGKQGDKMGLVGTQTLRVVPREAVKTAQKEAEKDKPSFQMTGYNGKLLYANVDNSLVVKVNAIADKDVRLASKDETVIIKNTGDQMHLIKPKNAGEVELEVYAIIDGKEQLIDTESFICLPLPQPQITLAGKKAGDISGVLLKKAKGLEAELPNVKLPGAGCQVLSFTLKRYAKTGNYAPVENISGVFGKAVRKHIENAAKDDLFLFSDIVVQTLDGKKHDMPDQAFVVR